MKVLYGHVCYTLHVGFLTWSAAARDCRAKGGQLFKVDSEELAAAILEKTGPFTAWTGAIERDGQFYWLDGRVYALDDYFCLNCLFFDAL